MVLQENKETVLKEIEKACKDSCRSSKEVALMIVSKTQSMEKIETLIQDGHFLFGENKVQEAKEKFLPLKEKYPETKLHLIGPLQTNKVKEAVALFDVIESVDREDLAQKLVKEMEKQGKNIPCFVQVNTGEEKQKSGISPKHTVRFVKACQEMGLEIKGLMCIPPFEQEPSAHFAFLKKLALEAGVLELSMGMSEDYPLAIQQGATIVRVGSLIFGQREKKTA